MNVSTLFFCCLLFLLPPAALQAQEATYLNPFENAFYLTEKGDQAFDLTRLENATFLPLDDPQLFEKLNDQTLWLKFTVENTTTTTWPYFFMIYNAYLPTGQVIVHHQSDTQQGFVHHFNKQQLANIRLNHPVWPLHLKPGKNTIYVKFYDQAKRTRILSFLLNERTFFKWKIQSVFAAFAFCLTLGIISLIILFGARYIRAPYFVFYCLYLLGLVLDFLAYKGWGAAYLWREQPFLLDNIRSLGNTLSTLGISFFFYHFYREYHTPKWTTNTFRYMGYCFTFLLLLYAFKWGFGGMKSLFIYVFYGIQGYALCIVVIHGYLAVKRYVPIYLPLVFILHTLSVYLQTQLNFPITGQPFMDTFSVNLYYWTLTLEIGVLTYYIVKKMLSIKQNNAQLLEHIQELQEKIIAREKETPEIIKLHSKAVVRVRDIHFLKSDDKYVEYHTKNKCEIERIALKEALEQLPSQQFVQCHKSYVVNLLQIRQVYADKIIMQQGETLPLSRTFKTQMSALMH